MIYASPGATILAGPGVAQGGRVAYVGVSSPHPPLHADAVRDRLVAGDSLRWRLEIVDHTDSTNADVAAAARAGTPEGYVRVAEHQRAGRGRAGRRWSSPPRAGLAASVLLRPTVPMLRWGWIPLLAGVAVAEAIGATTAVTARLKWPNDVLVGGHKCAGILAEAAEGAVVLGIGLNVHGTEQELPTAAAGAIPPTSLALAGAPDIDRGALLVALLGRLDAWYTAWTAHAGDPEGSGLRRAYLAACATVGQPVRALLPAGGQLTGRADTVDIDGRLVVHDRQGNAHPLSAGDITHLRT